LLGGGEARAQSKSKSLPLTAYYQNVPLWSEATELSESALSDFNRIRLMSEPVFKDFSMNVAYEQLLTLRQRETLQGIFVGAVPGGGEWLPLQWTIEDSTHVLWQHRFDRLAIGWNPNQAFDLIVGRQAISWATTLFLTPADPFSPFNPADPFREFRAGVDAVRAQIFPGPLSQLDFVVRATDFEATGSEVTALARGLTTWKNWELSGWGGALYEGLALAGAAAGSVGPAAVRGEAVVQREEDETLFRGTIGLDRRFDIWSRDFYVVLEYQRDGLGAASPDEYTEVLTSPAFQRGEFQVLGRDEIASQAQYQLHPLWSLSVLWLLNLNDPSTLLSPSFVYSASDEATVMGGVFLGFGDDELVPGGSLPSEYGLTATTVYLSVSVFF
jgi:hypothetical protein